MQFLSGLSGSSDEQECIAGVWVVKSELLFGPPLVRGVRASRMTESRTELWRAARDFALCLVDAGSRVTRYLKSDLHTEIIGSR